MEEGSFKTPRKPPIVYKAEAGSVKRLAGTVLSSYYQEQQHNRESLQQCLQPLPPFAPDSNALLAHEILHSLVMAIHNHRSRQEPIHERPDRALNVKRQRRPHSRRLSPTEARMLIKSSVARRKALTCSRDTRRASLRKQRKNVQSRPARGHAGRPRRRRRKTLCINRPDSRKHHRPDLGHYQDQA
jgi:hypothetical protein